MGLIKNYYHDEIIAAQNDQRADEFDCYEARLHSLLSDLDWLKGHPEVNRSEVAQTSIDILQSYIARIMGRAASDRIELQEMMK